MLYEIIEHIMPRMSFLMTVGAVELGLSMELQCSQRNLVL